jgi:hypothetical protein
MTFIGSIKDKLLRCGGQLLGRSGICQRFASMLGSGEFAETLYHDEIAEIAGDECTLAKLKHSR